MEPIVRPLELKDDLKQVARLVYETDDYIFPYLFDRDIAAAEKVISAMIGRDTIYHYKNIVIALLEDKIAGIVVLQKTPIRINSDEMRACFLDTGLNLGAHFERVLREYYEPLQDEPEGVYIANVCVDKAFRRMGVARKMLKAVLNDRESYHLETVKGNAAALRLYQSLGFETVDEYMGFDTPCYRMKRTKQPPASH